MKKVFRTCILGAFLVIGHLGCALAQSVNPPAGSPVSPADEAAIRAILERQTDAWNKHDIDAFVAETRLTWIG